MEEIRWHLLWKQMSPGEQYLSLALMALIVGRITFKLLFALGVIDSYDAPANPDSGEEAAGVGLDAAKTAASSSSGGKVDKWGKKGAPPGGKRLRVVIAFAVALGLLLPVWLYITMVQRAALPFIAMDAEKTGGVANLPALPMQLHVTIMRSDTKKIVTSASWWAREAAMQALTWFQGQEVTEGISPRHTWEVTAAVAEPAESPPLGDDATDAAMDAWLRIELGRDMLHGKPAAGHYHLVLLEGSRSSPRVVFGQHRHAWVHGLHEILWVESMLAPVLGDCAIIAAKYFGRAGDGGGVANAIKHWPVPAEGKVLLSFSLLNAAPEPGYSYGWDLGGEAAQQYLRPLVNALAPVARLTTDSQVLYGMATRAQTPISLEAGSYIVEEYDLPFFIDSEWPLDSSVVAPDIRVLRFVVYVPDREKCPLHVRLRDGSLAPQSAFTVPGWGGLLVWNPPACLENGTSPGSGVGAERAPESHNSDIEGEELGKVMSVAAGQLRKLFGLSPGPPHGAGSGFQIVSVPAASTAFAQWEMDALMRAHLAAAHAAAVASLASLGNVVKAIPNMVLQPVIPTHLNTAIRSLHAARRLAGRGSLEDAVRSSADAHAHAERAFFHPSILSLLYFPGEHKLAVYLPLGLPVLLSLCIRTGQEVYRWLRRRHAARAILAAKKKE